MLEENLQRGIFFLLLQGTAEAQIKSSAELSTALVFTESKVRQQQICRTQDVLQMSVALQRRGPVQEQPA